ncbi:hypothetical protein N7466_011135 [Penicillium verhagenii]|uniref:uncharacterized protein n=1 Tax=Penicillium verhagenii TaxID=1562060 RepID=UPI0025450A8E|nr:uncharacterized protein N7466_011104 [Penicillium verhagenii]XP_057016256.1 uncharacterized protein N7466_011135 [Penicillium verhagenii]KAJ5917550.1 hypothetical protein N7466_011104 [Penicillium verhagenii]KAJ5917581.1 hypothetical protein N7466_011135 [Penicillium verhagenii]
MRPPTPSSELTPLATLGEPLLQPRCIATWDGRRCEDETTKELRYLASTELHLLHLSSSTIIKKSIVGLLLCQRCKEHVPTRQAVEHRFCHRPHWRPTTSNHST